MPAATDEIFQSFQSSSLYITLTCGCCRTPGALSVNAIKVQSNGSLAGGLISGVSGMSNASFDSTQPIKAGVENFNSDGTPRASITPRASSYLAPESARAERSSDSQNRASLLGVKLQPLSVEPSGGSLLSPGSSKKVCAVADQTTCRQNCYGAMLAVMSDLRSTICKFTRLSSSEILHLHKVHFETSIG